MSTLPQPSQAEEPLDAITLQKLLEQEASEAEDFALIEDEKPKRKRKPKPQPRFALSSTARLSLLSGLLGFGLAILVALFVTVPVQQVNSPALPQVEAVPVRAEYETLPTTQDEWLDRWLVLTQTVGSIPAGQQVRILSLDDTPGYYNIADMEGHLVIVSQDQLALPTNPLPDDLHPPAGPFADALGQTQKRLRTVESNSDLPAGTEVYTMGLRVEDGMWIYEVSPDRQRVYFLPSIHLEWITPPEA